MRHRLSVIAFVLSSIVLITSVARAQVNGVPVCTNATGQTSPGIVSDGAGGAIVAWTDARNGSLSHRVYAQRLNAAGLPQWAIDGIPVSIIAGQDNFVGGNTSIVSDGAGGAIIAWVHTNEIYVQRLSASGTLLWPAIDPNRNGVDITPGALTDNPTLTLDSAGGVIVAWVNYGNPLGPDIYAQRVSSDGIVQWDILHRAVVTAPGFQIGPLLVSDGAGGAIVTWFDERTGFDIYMERMDGTGTPQWGTGNGVFLASTWNSGDPAPIIADGAGGAIITWESPQPDIDLYAQRVNAAGATQWAAGVPVSTAANAQYLAKMVSDGATGAIITWQDTRSGPANAYTQRLNASGVSQWTPDGVQLCSNSSTRPAIAGNGAGGAIVAWTDDRDVTDHFNIFGRAVSAAGVPGWPANGTAICTATLDQNFPVIESNGGVAIVAWQDRRSGSDNYDIYAEPISVLTGVHDTPSVSALSLTPNYPNPFLSRTSMSLDLPAAGDVNIEVFDVAGRRVRHADLGRMSAGSREMRFDGHDDAGRQLPSGVYFYRVHAGAETVTEKMVIAR